MRRFRRGAGPGDHRSPSTDHGCDTPESGQPTIRSIYDEFRPRGLSGIEVLHSNDQVGAFDIWVAASEKRRQHRFVKPVEEALGEAGSPRAIQPHHIFAEETRASGRLTCPISATAQLAYPYGPARSSDRVIDPNATDAPTRHIRGVREAYRREHGAEAPARWQAFLATEPGLHAERAVIQELITDRNIRGAATEGAGGERLPPCRLDLDVTRSPCPACAREIVAKKRFVESLSRQIAIRVAAYRPYSPPSEGQEGIRILQAEGVVVSVRQLTEEEQGRLTSEELQGLAEEQAELNRMIEVRVGQLV